MVHTGFAGTAEQPPGGVWIGGAHRMATTGLSWMSDQHVVRIGDSSAHTGPVLPRLQGVVVP